MEESRLRQLIELEESERNLLQRLDREKEKHDQAVVEYESYIEKLKHELSEKQQEN